MHRNAHRNPIRLMALSTLCLGTAIGSGCALSEKSQLEDHLGSVMQPGGEGGEDVIMAFGLDQPSVPADAVANRRDR